MRAPPATLVVAASITMLPAAPAPVVATEIRPPLARARRGVVTVMEPAVPAPEAWLDVVLKRPLSASMSVTELAAVMARLPPRPVPVVLLSTRAPLATLIVPVSITTLPAAPAPTVATEILPPSVSDSFGVEQLMAPPDPARGFALEAVLNRPLLASLMKSR